MSQWGRGNLIKDRYRLLDKLGQGGMGSVWRAEHVELKSQVAVKLLDPAIAKNEEMVARFLREARASASLKSRHVVQVFDHGIQDGNAFMVMELLHGQTLGDRIERDGRLDAEQAVRFMCQVMRAIGGAHEQGIIHRDLKPDNIFITSDDEGEYAKVLDFGVAKVKGTEMDPAEGVKTQTGMMLGTPYYMSPEQAKAKSVDHRTDVWALGVITFECLIGKRPFSGDSFGDLVIKLCSGPVPIPSSLGQVPLGFDEWFVRATQREVDRRFTSAREMADELMQLAHNPLIGRRSDGPLGEATGDGTHVGVERPSGPRPMRAPRPAAKGARPLGDTTGRGAALGLDRPQIPLNKGPSRLGLVALGILAAAAIGAVVAQVLPPRGQWTPLADSAMAPAPVAEPRPAASPALAEDVAMPEQLLEDDARADATEPTSGAESPAPAVPPLEANTGTRPAPTAALATKALSTKPKASSKAGDKEKPASHGTAPPAKGSGERAKAVPVVDKQTLPPQSWEF